MPRALRRLASVSRAHGAALALYGLLTLASFYPQSVRPRDTVAYVGDSLESVYIVAWNVHQAFRAPAHLFDANVLHPHPRALAFTDHRLLPSLLVAPVVWATGNPVLACNVAVALACLLAAMAGRHLATILGAGTLAAWTAGALYAFHTYQVNEAPRLNIVFHGFLPLALGELVRYLRSGEPRRAWTTAGAMLLQGLSSNYHLLYGALLLAFVLVGTAVARPRLLAARLPWLSAAALAAALAFLPVAWPYVATSRAHGLARELPPGIGLEHYVSTAPTNLLYGAIGTEVRLQQRGPHFVGFVSMGLALLAGAAWARGRGPEPETSLLSARLWVPCAAALALLFAVLALGRDVSVGERVLGPGPYRLLWELVPGFRLVRIPERLALVAMLFVGLLVARGLDLLVAGGWPRLALLLAAAVPLEHVGPLPVSERVPVGRDVPRVYAWLRDNATGAVAETPIRGEALVRQETVEMYFSAFHFKRIVHGYTAYPPLVTRLLRRFTAEFPSELSLEALRRVDVDTVVVHHGRLLGADLRRQINERGEEESDRLAPLLRRAGLDLYDRLGAAVAAGRIRREARFEGPTARLYESRADEVFRILAGPQHPPAPFPRGRRMIGTEWRYRTKIGDPAPATDEDLGTSWVVPRALLGDEHFEVVFDRPLRVAGLVLPLRRDSAFPTRFRIGGRDGEGRWAEVARFDEPHALQLLDRARQGGPTTSLGFDLGGRELTGLSLLVEEGGTSVEGWSLPEVEVWSPEGSP